MVAAWAKLSTPIMLKISVRPELSMNSSRPELMPLSRLMRNWSKDDPETLAKKEKARGRWLRRARGWSGDQAPGRFIWHEVGVLDT
jgi:hypothetical protein